MFRHAAHSSLRHALRTARPAPNRRFASTAPPHLKSRSWRNFAVRCGIAGGLVYYYNTSELFADEPALLEDAKQIEDESLPTLASLSPSSRFRPPTPEDKPTAPVTPSAYSPSSLDPKAPSPTSSVSADADLPSPQSLEEEAEQQGAFNEETGEINWDCPCLGGMAHGPCGEEFRAAFSCFVFSKEEPKGMDCIEHFKGMQGCFREHPDVYGAELDDDEEETQAQAGAAGEEGAMAPASLSGEEPAVAAAAAEEPVVSSKSIASQATSAKSAEEEAATARPVSEGLAANLRQKKSIYDTEDERGLAPSLSDHDTRKQSQLLPDHSRGRSTANPAAGVEEDGLVPKASHDARDADPK